jgi:hypothetical protein
MSEEKIPLPDMHHISEMRLNATPLLHRDGSLEHEYLVNISPDLPPVKLRVFIFANGDAQVEAEFEQVS